MKHHIYLFRHGSTKDNLRGVFSGFRNVPLTKRGIEDAKIIALRLKDKKIDVAFQSNLKRSQQTLKEVLKFHPECRKIITDPRIKERNYGLATGMTHYQFIMKNSIKKYDETHRGYYSGPPKGESIKDVEKRVNPFIKDLIELVKKEKVNVAISCHGNTMRPLRRYFEKLTTNEMIKIESPFDNYFEYTINTK